MFLEFKLTITSELFPAVKDITQTNIAYPEEYCFHKNDIQNYFDEIVKNTKTNELFEEWKLEIKVYLGGALYDNCIGIYKRGFTYVKDKCKEVSIRISLPSIDEIDWGIDKKRFMKNSIKNSRMNKIIPVEYNKYKNMSEYIEDSIKKSISNLFIDGITLKGQKIKLRIK
jgi:hypothetical protein